MGVVKLVKQSGANQIAENTTGGSAKWNNARTITLDGDLSGSVSIDGTANVTLTSTVRDDAVETAMIKDGSVLTAKIGADNITNALIADGAINPENLSGTLGAGTAGDILVSDGDGTFSWETRPVNNNTLTLVGGVGMSDTIGDFTANQGSDESLTINLAIDDLADGGADLAAGDKFAFYDSSGSDHNNATITQLSAFQAGAGIDANSGVLSINLGSLSSFDAIQKGDGLIGLDGSNSGATGKTTVADVGAFYAGTGISTASDGKLHVDATQAITNISGNLEITGDLTVSGATITTATETLEIADNTMLLNSDLTGSTAVDAGMVVNRADATGDKYKHLFWDESKGGWAIGSHDTSSAMPATSNLLMVNAVVSGTPDGTETNVGGLVFDSGSDEIYLVTS